MYVTFLIFPLPSFLLWPLLQQYLHSLTSEPTEPQSNRELPHRNRGQATRNCRPRLKGGRLSDPPMLCLRRHVGPANRALPLQALLPPALPEQGRRRGPGVPEMRPGQSEYPRVPQSARGERGPARIVSRFAITIQGAVCNGE